MNPDDYRFHRPPNTAAHQFRGQHIISDQVGQGELTVMWRELEKIIKMGVPGDIVELGCYVGTTSSFIRRLLDEAGESAARAFHVYDSFEGLPPKSQADESAAGTDFQAGKLSVSKKEFLQQFRAANLRPPIIHKGWFNELTDKDVPEQIAFAFLDGDFYESIMDSLKLVWPRLSPGGTVLIDDYGREALPGAERAADEFFKGKATGRAEANVFIVRKPASSS
jgi:O-methyltransferase